MKLPLLTLGKTGFVTLLMIGMAMTGCGQSKPKIAIPAGQFDAATFKGPWPTKKVDCIDLGNNYFNVHYQDGTELHFADSRPNRDVPPIPDPMPPDVDNADLCSELHADKPAKPPAKKVAPIVTACTGCVTVPDPPPSLPLDVPAIRKTVKDEPNCSTSYIAGSMNSGWTHPGAGDFPTYCTNEPTSHQEWHCVDDDAYSLQVSVSGKAANCHRIVP